MLKLRACMGTEDMLKLRACMGTEDVLKLRACMGTEDMLKLRACMGTEDMLSMGICVHIYYMGHSAALKIVAPLCMDSSYIAVVGMESSRIAFIQVVRHSLKFKSDTFFIS